MKDCDLVNLFNVKHFGIDVEEEVDPVVNLILEVNFKIRHLVYKQRSLDDYFQKGKILNKIQIEVELDKKVEKTEEDERKDQKEELRIKEEKRDMIDEDLKQKIVDVRRVEI